MTLLGMDVSLWNSDRSEAQYVDWVKARNAGIQFAFLKASQSAFCDPDFIINYNNAKLAGVPVGAYHYFTWEISAKSQAEFFWGMIKNNPVSLYPVIDYECRTNVPTKATAHKALVEFINRFQELSARKVMIYTSPSFWKEYGYTIDPVAVACPLWIAHWGTEYPIRPKPWTDWTFHQYTDKGDGLLYGCESVNVDLNNYNGDAAQFEATFGVKPATPEEVIQPSDAVQTTAYLNVRTQPIISTTNKIGTVPPGTILLKAGDKEGAWQPVTTYVHGDYVKDL
jgi:lysozyme